MGQVHSPLQEEAQVSPVAEPGSPNTKVLHQSEVLHLMIDDAFIEDAITLEIVGLDAADVGRLFAHEYLHQVSQTVLELGGGLSGQGGGYTHILCTWYVGS